MDKPIYLAYPRSKYTLAEAIVDAVGRDLLTNDYPYIQYSPHTIMIWLEDPTKPFIRPKAVTNQV